MTIPTNPNALAIAGDARFHSDPSAFYAELRDVLSARMGDPESGTSEASKIWADAQRITPALPVGGTS